MFLLETCRTKIYSFSFDPHVDHGHQGLASFIKQASFQGEFVCKLKIYLKIDLRMKQTWKIE